MCKFRRLALGLWTGGIVVVLALGQPLSAWAAQGPAAAASPTANRPIAAATRIQESEAPVIDGDVSDPVWAKATVIDKLTQTEPNNGDALSERTIVRFLYDSENIYIAIYAYDSSPDQIVATVMSRDGPMPRDDFARITIDPNLTRRDAYAFEINALGGRTEALVQNNSDYLTNWNTIWAGKAMIVGDGWTAEVAIPFRDLSFDPNNSNWGFDFFRQIKRKTEKGNWGPQPAASQDFDQTYAGTLTGMSGMNQGEGLDIQLYGTTKYKHQTRGHEDNDLTFQPSGNLYYKITPGLTGTLTVNTDFSDAPLDRRQVNTTRFSLFTQESRQFFLQDAASFEFGGHGFAAGFGGGNLVNGRPFFSRNIGLVSGFPASIVAGGKLSGQVGGVNIGALTVQTGGTDTTDGQLLSVARVTVPVFSESKVGMIVTNGDPTGATDNTTIGGDFQFSDSNFMDSRKRLQADAYYVESISSLRGDDSVYGVSALFPNEPLSLEGHWKRVGANYTPALGFANRKGVNEYRFNATYRERFRDSPLLWAQGQTRNYVVTGLDGKIQSRDNTIWGEILTADGDQLQGTVFNDFEDVPAPFFLPNGVVVSAGRYTWSYFSPRIGSSQARPVSFIIDFDCCDYYNGHIFSTNSSIDWRPNGAFSVSLQYSGQYISLPTGNVDINIWTLEPNINFTPDMTLNTQIQYDTISNRFQLLARYRWEYAPETEVFVALGENSVIDGEIWRPSYRSDFTTLIFRLGHTLRF